MDIMVAMLQDVDMDEFAYLAGDDGAVSWDELAPMVGGICYAGDEWDPLAIAPVPEEVSGCEASFVDNFGSGCDWYWDISFADLRCNADSYKNDEGYKAVDCCPACW